MEITDFRMDFFSLKGKNAIVTGGNTGLGQAFTLALAKGGANVFVPSIMDDDGTTGPLVEAEGVRYEYMKADITAEGVPAQVLAECVSRLGSIDILVNSAGIAGPTATVLDIRMEDWHRTIAINLNGTFFTNRAVVPHMLAGDYGRIVNIASVAGKEGNPNASAYSTSKAAVIGLTKSIGKELAQTNVRVNCVTPAAVRTPIFDQMTQEHIDFMLSKIPIGRFGTVDEVASLICWLASGEASFSTGAVFDVSGGRATY